MAKLLTHEVWMEPGPGGRELPSCCLSGPQGDDFRRTLGPGARLWTTFEAGSHFEAMTLYHRLLGRGEYTTSEAGDHRPYPDSWFEAQEKARRRA